MSRTYQLWRPRSFSVPGGYLRIFSRRTLIVQLFQTVKLLYLSKLLKIDHFRLSKWSAIMDIPLTSAVDICQRLRSMKTSCCFSFSPYLTENSLRHKTSFLDLFPYFIENTARIVNTNHGERS